MRLINADALEERMCRQCTIECGGSPCDPDECFIRDVIRDAPTVDAVEVVRCKECRFWDDDRRCNGIENGLVREYTWDDDFCSYGERRTNETK